MIEVNNNIPKKVDYICKEVYHFWVGNKTGYIFSTSKVCPIQRPKERLKYLGFTQDFGWPKKMNTGRILYRPGKNKISYISKRNKRSSANN